MTKSMHIALEDLKLERIFVIYPGKDVYPLHERVEALPLTRLPERLGMLKRRTTARASRRARPSRRR
jgi:hypothetical protein